jgi:hypothetical protein
MFEQYIIVENETENIVEDGKVIGYKIAARVPYYRGLGISMIEDIQLKIDGNVIAAEQLQIELHGNTYTLATMETEADDRWEFGEVGFIKVIQAGGLTHGKHQIDLLFNLRISYMPVNAVRKDSKTLSF